MSRSKRKTETTYYDLLNLVDARIEFEPLSLSELGLLFYILQSCNKNYGDECTLNLRVVSAKTLAEVRRLPGKLQTLAEKGYIDCVEVAAKVWQISVKRLAFANEPQGTEPILATREEKENADKKDNFIYKNINTVNDKVFSQRKLPDNNSDTNFQKRISLADL